MCADCLARLGSDIIARPPTVGPAMVGFRLGFLNTWGGDERRATMWTVTIILC
jgi:hypothetical protein